MRLDATTKGGEKKKLLALVDSGAKVNLFRSGLFHARDTTNVQNPISLVTVDGARLGGVDKEIELVLTFLASTGKKTERVERKSRDPGWRLTSSFDIGLYMVDKNSVGNITSQTCVVS